MARTPLCECGLVPGCVAVPRVQVGNRCVTDLSNEEEPCAAASLHVAVTADGRLAGVTKEGSKGINPSVLQVWRLAGGTHSAQPSRCWHEPHSAARAARGRCIG